MKLYIFLFCLFLFTINVIAQRNIETIYITESGFSSTHIIPLDKKIIKAPNYEITFEIIDPETLDPFFNDQIGLNGKFSYKYYDSSIETFFEKRKRRQKDEVEDIDYIHDGLTFLKNNGEISDEEYTELAYQIDEHYLEDPDRYKTKSTHSNPFFINGTYLSVFKMTILNESVSDVTINKEDLSLYSGIHKFQILSNKEILNAYTNDYAIDYKYHNLLKYNFTENVTISGGKKIIKYFVTLPLINEDDDINLIYGDKSIHWSNKIEKSSFHETFKYYGINVNPRIGGDNLPEHKHFYVVRNIEGDIFVDNNKNKVYTKFGTKFSLFSYTLYKGKLLYGTTDILIPEDYIDMEKKRREKILIKYSKLEID